MRLLTTSTFTFAGLALFAVNACQCDGEVSGVPGNLVGNICDEDSGQPLVNVNVHMDGTVQRDSVTNVEGGYIFSGVPVGKYTVSADVDGKTRTVKAEVKADDTSFVNKDTACRPPPDVPFGGDLAGQICNRHTGGFVSNADVIVEVAVGDPLTTTTDDQGNFLLHEVPEGPQVVQIRAAGYQRSFAVDIVANQTFELDLADDCNSVDPSEGGIVGGFCDPSQTDPDPSDPLNNGHLVGADVKVTNEDTAELTTDVTDTDGQFEINGLTPGLYNVDVQKGTSYHFSVPHVQVIATQLATVTDPGSCADQPSVGRIEGQICSSEVGAGGFFTGTVDLVQGITTIKTTTSDSSGAFNFNLVDPGTYSVHAHGGTFDRVFSPVVVEAFRTTFLDVLDCPPPDDICTPFTNQPDVTSDGRILLVVDRSGSMQENDDTGSQQKWVSMKNALTTVTNQLQTHVEFGLMLYPGPDVANDVCDGGNEVLGLALNNAGSIATKLNQSTPNGGTPTAVTMAAAKTIVQSTLNGDGPTKRPLAVLLATDGGPNCNTSLNPQFCTCTNPDDILDDGVCTNVNCLDDSNVLSQIGAIHQLGIKTFVIGVLGVAAFDGVLSSMADAGGTTQPGTQHYFPANNQAQLESALDAITHQVLACHIEKDDVDFNAVHSVHVSVGSQTLNQDVLRHNGWDITGAHTIDLFGSACDTASAPNAPNVTVETCVAP